MKKLLIITLTFFSMQNLALAKNVDYVNNKSLKSFSYELDGFNLPSWVSTSYRVLNVRVNNNDILFDCKTTINDTNRFICKSQLKESEKNRLNIVELVNTAPASVALILSCKIKDKCVRNDSIIKLKVFTEETNLDKSVAIKTIYIPLKQMRQRILNGYIQYIHEVGLFKTRRDATLAWDKAAH